MTVRNPMVLKKGVETVFLVISAPGVFESEIKHYYFKPAISAPYSLVFNQCLAKFMLVDFFLEFK